MQWKRQNLNSVVLQVIFQFRFNCFAGATAKTLIFDAFSEIFKKLRAIELVKMDHGSGSSEGGPLYPIILIHELFYVYF